MCVRGSSGCIRPVIIGRVIESAIYIEISVVTDEHPGPAGHSADDDCALIVPVHRLNDTLFRSYGENYFGPPILGAACARVEPCSLKG